MRFYKNIREKINYKESIAEMILSYASFDKKRNLKILDIGCGLGEFCNYYSSEYKNDCTGIDINKKFIEHAKKKYKGVNFFTQDCISPPQKIKKNKYDLILFIGSRVLDYACYNKKEVLNCIKKYQKLLTENGKIFIIENTDFSGKIENKAGWKFKTYKELIELKKNFYNSKIIFTRGVSKLKFIYNNFFLRNLANIFLQIFRTILRHTTYFIIINKNSNK